MAPPRNTRRRKALADAVIEVLGTAGIHKLSHRAADERAGLPAGTAANYFPRRDDLLAAAAERVAELALAEMAAADRAYGPGEPDSLGEPDGLGRGGSLSRPDGLGRPDGLDRPDSLDRGGLDRGGLDRGGLGGPDSLDRGDGLDLLAGLIGASLYEAASRHRTRYLAAYELALQSTRQPELAAALSRLSAGMLDATVAEHRALGLPTTPAQVQALITLFNGTLLTLAVAPPEAVTREGALILARCLVTGVLGTNLTPPPPPPPQPQPPSPQPPQPQPQPQP